MPSLLLRVVALSSSSTFTQVEVEYFDTASYRINESASEARRHSVSITFLLRKSPSSSTKGSNVVSYDMSLLLDEKKKADDYADLVDGGRVRRNIVTRIDSRNMRGQG